MDSMRGMMAIRSIFSKRFLLQLFFAALLVAFGWYAFHIIRIRREVALLRAVAPGIREQWRARFGEPADTPAHPLSISQRTQAEEVLRLLERIDYAEKEFPRDVYYNWADPLIEHGAKPGAVPAGASEWLRKHGDELTGLGDYLANHQLPVWEKPDIFNSTSLFLGLSSYHRLQRLLLIHVYVSADRGDRDSELKALETAFRLNQTILAVPDRNFLNSGLSEHNQLLTACRALFKGNDTPANCSVKLDHTQLIRRVMMSERFFQDKMNGWLAREDAKRFVFVKWLRGYETDELVKNVDTLILSEQIRISREALECACTQDCRTLSLTPMISCKISSSSACTPAYDWELQAESQLFSIDDLAPAIRRSRRAEESLEKLFAVRAARMSAPDHLWPAKVNGIEPGLCSGYNWSYQPSPDRMSMTLTRQWNDRGEPDLRALTYKETISDSAAVSPRRPSQP